MRLFITIPNDAHLNYPQKKVRIKARFLVYFPILLFTLSSTDVKALPFNFKADPQKSILKAIQANDVQKVEMILDQNDLRPLLDFRESNKNIKDKDTILNLAVRKGNADIVRLILKSAPNPDMQVNSNGLSPLMNAAFQGHGEIVKILLLAKANPNFATRAGVTALILATQEGHLQVVKILLAAGATPNLAMHGARKATPLYIAANNDHMEVFDELLKTGRFNLRQEIELALSLHNTDVANILRAIRNSQITECRKRHLKTEEGISILAKNLEDISEAQLKKKAQECYNDILAKKALLKVREQKNNHVEQLEAQLKQLEEKDDSFSLEEQGKLQREIQKAKMELSNLERDTQCPICMECLFEKRKIVSPLCGHLYCKECYKRLFTSGDPACPLCRGDLCGKTSLEILTK